MPLFELTSFGLHLNLSSPLAEPLVVVIGFEAGDDDASSKCIRHQRRRRDDRIHRELQGSAGQLHGELRDRGADAQIHG